MRTPPWSTGSGFPDSSESAMKAPLPMASSLCTLAVYPSALICMREVQPAGGLQISVMKLSRGTLEFGGMERIRIREFDWGGLATHPWSFRP